MRKIFAYSLLSAALFAGACKKSAEEKAEDRFEKAQENVKDQAEDIRDEHKDVTDEQKDVSEGAEGRRRAAAARWATRNSELSAAAAELSPRGQRAADRMDARIASSRRAVTRRRVTPQRSCARAATSSLPRWTASRIAPMRTGRSSRRTPTASWTSSRRTSTKSSSRTLRELELRRALREHRSARRLFRRYVLGRCDGCA